MIWVLRKANYSQEFYCFMDFSLVLNLIKMKLPILAVLIFFFLDNSVWAQQQVPEIVFEKSNGKLMRIEKYRKVHVVSEKNFTTPKYAVNEVTVFSLEHYMTTYNKNKMVHLVSGFLNHNGKFFDFDKLGNLHVTCYFDKSTFELKEITYNLHPGSLSNYSVLRDLTEEIKTKGDVSIKDNFRARVGVPSTNLDKYVAKYFRLGFTLWDSDLKPHLNEGGIKN